MEFVHRESASCELMQLERCFGQWLQIIVRSDQRTALAIEKLRGKKRASSGPSARPGTSGYINKETLPVAIAISIWSNILKDYVNLT